MKRRVVRTPQAEREIMQIAYYFADEASYDVSDRFLRAVDKATRQIVNMPGVGALRDYDNPELIGMRMLPLPKFLKYLLFYRLADEDIEILRVLHGARDLQAIFGPDDEE